MAQSRHVGLIGFGAIGRELFARLASDTCYKLTLLLRERGAGRVAQAATIVHTLEDLIAARPALVVEAAGQGAVVGFVPQRLASGIGVIVASTGALGDRELLARLSHIAEQAGTRLIVPAGAIGGLDYLAALRDLDGVSVCYTCRKPVLAWADELLRTGQDPATLREALVLFEGSAAEAARRYPRNLNAGLTVALVAGHDRTRVRVIADPSARHNTHEITVDSPAGTASVSFANLLSSANPKTSAITALSLAAAVRRHFETVVI